MLHKDLTNQYYVDWLAFLEKSKAWSRQEIDDYQFLQLKNKAEYVWEHTPGYRKLWQTFGVHPNSLKSLEDVNAFPRISKAQLCEDIDAFTVKKEGMAYTSTGGSTGIALGFYRTAEAFARELASKAHQYHRVGWREGDRQVVLRGVPITHASNMQFFPEFNELRFSSYHLTLDEMEKYRKKSHEYQPEWLRCYPSSGYRFAKYIQESGKPFPPLKGILVSSENLYDFQKKCMEDAFSCRIFNHYGQFEQVALAGYCEKADTFHVLPHYGHVQLLDANGNTVTTKGMLGEIVATSFLMDATCFFRYNTGDFAVYGGESCPACGRPYQIWERVEGRLQDFIVTKSNRYISLTAMNMHDDIFFNIKQFQYYQDSPGVVILKYIPKDMQAAYIDEEDIKKRLYLKLGEDVELHLRKVDEGEMQRTPRGKFMYIQQKLKLGAYDICK